MGRGTGGGRGKGGRWEINLLAKLVSPFACCTHVTSRDSHRWKTCSQASGSSKRVGSRRNRGKSRKRAEGRKPRKRSRSQEKLKAGDLEPLPLPLQSTLSKTDTFRTGTSCPSYRKSNRGSKERQGPTLGVRFTEVSVKRESTVYCEWSSFFPQSQTLMQINEKRRRAFPSFLAAKPLTPQACSRSTVIQKNNKRLFAVYPTSKPPSPTPAYWAFLPQPRFHLDH